IVENPETYSYLTGMQNLRQYKRMRKGVTEERLKEVVKLVGLENRIHEKVKRYSLGMRQRLGLAQAIMHRPKLIVMDEPTNGLDPSGIRELRDIFKRLAHEEGVSVLVSSHLLSEMELMCDRVGILANGRLIGVKPVKELIMEAQGNQRIVRFTVNDIESALGILEERKWEPFNVTENSFNIAIENDQQLGSIGIALAGADIWLLGIERQSHNLEDIFIEITGGGEQIA
ncbi:MAG TPA: bacitracin ABC transporter ATP-binding protein, partial [Ruminococcaceae bacterium]|nr:bacitracin ABC transporter ATP-binding protein [Oscillospiraceae bacterium]